MDLKHLRHFAAICDERSFSGAARRLNVAQSALSNSIRVLEGDLGVPLFIREPRGVRVTEAGQRLLPHAQQILAAIATARDAARGAEAAPEGEVRLGLPGPMTDIVGVPLVESVAQALPRVRLRLVEGMSGYVLNWLRRGEIDIAMLYVTVETMELALHPLAREPLDLIVPPDHMDGSTAERTEITFREATKLNLVLPGRPHGLRVLVERAAHRAGLTLSPVIETDSYPLIKQLVERGHGCAILPRVAVRNEVSAGRLASLRIVSPTLLRDIALAYATPRPPPRAMMAVEAVCREVVTRLCSEGCWPATVLPAANVRARARD
ncbi:MAG: LysR family transcriptional regulator [Alkalilacustris sp.]